MFSENLTRRVLAFSFFYNIFGTLVFLFPGQLGTASGLPVDAPFLHNSFIAANILLFGLVAGWLSRRHPIDLPLLTVFGILKVTFFVLMLIAGLRHEVTALGVLGAGVDLAMGVIFLGHAWQSSRR